MPDSNPEVMQLNEAMQLLTDACEVTEGILRTSDLKIDEELAGFFDEGEHPQFLGDLRRFSVDLSTYDENVDQYATYLGLGTGIMIAEFASVRIRFLRYEMESVTNDDPIEDRARRYDFLCRDNYAEILKQFLPQVFSEPYAQTDFNHAAAAIIGSSLRVMTDIGLQQRAKAARKQLKKHYKEIDSTSELTTEHVPFMDPLI
jgi:hypothetical protein